MDKKSIVNDSYRAAVISIFVVVYSLLGKKILKMTPPSIQKFDQEDMRKLVSIIALSDQRWHESISLNRTFCQNTSMSKNGLHFNVDWKSFGQCPSFHWQLVLVFEAVQGWH